MQLQIRRGAPVQKAAVGALSAAARSAACSSQSSTGASPRKDALSVDEKPALFAK
ncbi:hypothetical protein PR003_g15315 [Phytophthora rubi]|uniref:Uncharacterized protein n=1 Tax=Phytophthora rubi TaxID=129364 RepID=A0A6A3N557_9STRA|nr:hypothetical protein PR002_g5512 [Phytophthora rubi]KAE9330395.1 hypothetical protein PR003_g15315 [Phytophthora rubi]